MKKPSLEYKNIGDLIEESLDTEEKMLREKRNKLIFAAFLGILGFATLWVTVSFYAAFGIFLIVWGNNISESTNTSLRGYIYKKGEK